MTLSDAIRLGSMLKPQGRGALHKDGQTCAYGAAMDAIGCLPAEGAECSHDYDALGDEWPIGNVRAECPVTFLWSEVGDIVTDLNDVYGWSREWIADWVETIERQHAALESPPAVDAVVTAGELAKRELSTRERDSKG